MFTKGIKGFFADVKYAWQERKTPYVDNEALKEHYSENRSLYQQKMNSAFAHRENGNPLQFEKDLFSAVKYLDMSILWEKRARLAKNINDNRDNVPLTLWGTLISYGTSVGSAISTIPTIYTKGSNAPSDPFFLGGLVAFFVLGVLGIYQQKRLSRLVKEHKDYTREDEETKGLIEQKTFELNNKLQ